MKFLIVRKMEAEVVRMVIDMFHGDENCCGVVRFSFLSFPPSFRVTKLYLTRIGRH